MQFLPPLLFGISASLDALLVGITFGIRGAGIRFRENLLISTITLLGTCLSVGLGEGLTALLPATLWTLCGSLILILLGLYYIIKFMNSRRETFRESAPLTATQASSAMPFSQACSLGMALSANNMGIGLSASIAGLPLLSAATVTFFFSFIFLLLGNQLGQHHIHKLTEHSANLITGILLISLGIFQLIN